MMLSSQSSSLADRHCIPEKGRIARTGDSAALRADQAAINRYLSA